MKQPSNKILIITTLLAILMIVLSIGGIILLNSTQSQTVGNSNNVANSNSSQETQNISSQSNISSIISFSISSSSSAASTQTADILLSKTGNNIYNIILYNNKLDPSAIQLTFNTSNQIKNFSPETVYDAVLQNSYSGSIYNIAIGKLNNLKLQNTNITSDGGFIIGQLTLNNDSNGLIKLIGNQSILIDPVGQRNFTDYAFKIQ